MLTERLKSRQAMHKFIQALEPPLTVAIETGPGAQAWAREIQARGVEVKSLPAQHTAALGAALRSKGRCRAPDQPQSARGVAAAQAPRHALLQRSCPLGYPSEGGCRKGAPSRPARGASGSPSRDAASQPATPGATPSRIPFSLCALRCYQARITRSDHRGIRPSALPALAASL